jgi:small subunit ribosomal protein S3
MGQKVHPFGFRLGVIYDWQSHWYSEPKNYHKYLIEDLKIRKEIDSIGKDVALSKSEIERRGNEIRVRLYTARPGILIGKHGSNIEQLKKRFEKIVDQSVPKIEVIEVNKPEISAKLVGESIAMQIEKRMPFKRAMKQAIFKVMKNGALGIKVSCAGRLNGAEIARREWFREGRLPLHTIRAKIDYHHTDAHTKFGCIGIKVWIYSGDVLTDATNMPNLSAEYGG